MASSALSQAMTFKIQSGVLENLRAELVYANDEYAEQGSFSPGHDTISFITVPDLTLSTTVLTEGTAPTSQALTLSTTTLSTAQYGETVTITDVAKVKSPVDLVRLATERLGRQAKESIDKVTRDVIAASGTPYYVLGGSTNSARSDLASGEIIVGLDLIKLAAIMRKNKLEPFDDGLFRIFLSDNQIYDLQKETTATTSWREQAKHTSDRALLRNEIGVLHGFRVMRANNAPTFSSTVTVHAGIAVGRIKGWAAGDLSTLSVHHVEPGGDHSDPLGQTEIMGYKVNFGVAALSNSYYYRLESDATSL
jgi:N4-gp56 family major capsid protein